MSAPVPRLAVLAVLVCLAAGARAEPATSRPRSADPMDGMLNGFGLGAQGGPVHINADTMEFDYKTKILTYRGAVTVKQGDLTVRSDVLRVTLDGEQLKRPREVVAEGGVRITKGERQASGGLAVFDEAARTVTLSKAALLQDGRNEVAGEKVVVYLDEERSVVEGGRDRVRAVLYPSGAAGAAGADSDEP